jgi:hypothetical protein
MRAYDKAILAGALLFLFCTIGVGVNADEPELSSFSPDQADNEDQISVDGTSIWDEMTPLTESKIFEDTILDEEICTACSETNSEDDSTH